MFALYQEHDSWPYSNNMIYWLDKDYKISFLELHVNPFLANVPILYPLETSEKYQKSFGFLAFSGLKIGKTGLK